jgi:hypothetical protein
MFQNSASLLNIDMRLAELFFESVVIDNRNGLGAVPNNSNIDYLGLPVMMKPSTFLKLAGGGVTVNDDSYVKQHIARNLPIGAPFLIIKIPNEWLDGDFSKPATVRNHEGRHRMVSINQIYGDIPVEVHLTFGSLRARDISPEIQAQLNKELIPQSFGDHTAILRGPFFEPYIR